MPFQQCPLLPNFVQTFERVLPMFDSTVSRWNLRATQGLTQMQTTAYRANDK